MKVILYCDWFKEYTASLALSVAARTDELTLIVREKSPEFQRRREDEVKIHGELQKRRIDFYSMKGKYSSLSSLVEIHRIYLRKRQAGYDCFHLQQTGDPRFLWLALRMPTVLTVHEPAARRGVNRQTDRFRGFTYDVAFRMYRRLANMIVVHTKEGLEGLRPFERRKAVIIPHGVESRVIHQVGDSRTILFFGRAAAYKGIDTLLAAMTEVWKVDPDARLRILASPADYRCNAPMDSRVHATWDGYSNEELEQALSSARAVCLPYLSGAGTGVGAQAYGSGKPIVASDLDGLRELVPHDELLVKPESVTDLARALIAVLSKDYGVQNIGAERTWSGVGEAHIEVYQRLSEGRDR